MFIRRCAILALLLCGLSLLARAQQPVTSRIVNVALFKQGYGCIVREVSIPGGVSDVAITDMPAPVHGTFWILTPTAIKLHSALATEGERTQAAPAVSLPELLRANIGETIALKTAEGWLTGKLISVADNRTEKDTTAPAIPASQPDYYSGYYRPSPIAMTSTNVTQGNLLVLETAEGQTALPVNAVLQIRKPAGGGALKMAFTRTTAGATLHLRTQGPGGTARIAYLTRGLTWAPSYRLDISGTDARLQGKAVLINDAEDLHTQALDCLAGYPNMKFSHVVDPLAMKENVAQFLQSLQQPADSGTRTGRPSSVMTQVMSNSAYTPTGGADVPTQSEETREDIHHYQFKDVALKQGERAYLPFIDAQVSFSHLYRWEVRDLRADTYRWNDPRENEQPPAEDVWHAVRLKNAGKFPWTTAPVMVTEGDQFLGQDILYYTSAGGSTLVNITKAVDVKAKFTESTTDNPSDTTIGGHRYRVYVVSGRLQVNNFKAEKIAMLINKKLTGDLIETSIKPTTVTEEPRTDIANPHNTVTWEVEVPAGKSLEISYKYKVYIWNN